MNEKYNKYQNEYRKAKLERLSIDVKKGNRKKLKNYAKTQGKSLQQYIKELVKKDSGIDLDETNTTEKKFFVKGQTKESPFYRKSED